MDQKNAPFNFNIAPLPQGLDVTSPPTFNRVITGVNREILVANKNIISTDTQSHYLDPNGVDRDINLYASPVVGDYFIFKNIGTANILTLKDNGGTTIIVIGVNVAVAVEYDGTQWQLI